MNAVELPVSGPAKVKPESILRAALRDAENQAAVVDATGWDSTMLSKVLSGNAGITIDKLNAVIGALGLTITSVEYMDYLARGNVIGSNCHCARMNMGECGRRS
ncbi:helix-turn-helix transcriptional regulator [Paraburkholderia sp. Ac-20340]|uniref:helix-turn-helix domain-containing protein n=1 Tax=Paraburkholderia sp. Ac-20340 TaxID=2703888 RepID=UPI0019800024|nr:helix-turn-helix transcriptional regulator [Paraburkholderia sp. Ac-20340]MBN3853812.1 helix-turn-helix transcriptional regulator [Paraburkholderia sp. Ac-20340]